MQSKTSARKNLTPDEVLQFIENLTPEQYEGLMSEAWAEAERVLRGNYQPRGHIKKLFENNYATETLLSGPAGTGKSRGCFEYLHQQAMAWPGARILIVRKTRASLTQSGLVTFENEVLGRDHPILADKVTRRGRETYKYTNGAEIITGGMDKETRVMSSQYDIIYIQEATELTEGDYESLTSRMRNGIIPKSRLIADANPQSPRHYLYRRWQDKKLEMVFTQHQDNPTLYDEAAQTWTDRGVQYLDILNNLSGVRKERLLYGRWVASEGVVYDIDPAIHYVPRFDIPKSWRRICSVDFGYHNPFVCGWFAIDPDGNAYLYRYIYKSRRLLEDHIQQIKRINKDADESVEVYVCDHDSQEFEMMRRAGFNVVKAYKDITTGIQAVQARLKITDAKTRLMILEDSLVEGDTDLEDVKLPFTIEQEFDSYSWPKTDSGRYVKEVPVKEYDHGMDMIRYCVALVDNVGKTYQGNSVINMPAIALHPMQLKPGQMSGARRQLPPKIGNR